MNTFINRSVKSILAVLFISVAIIPAHAQWKKGIHNLPKVLGKRPSLTGTTPVVRPPVTPRVPPTVTGAAVPNFTAAVNKALDNAVTRRAIQPFTPLSGMKNRDMVVPQTTVKPRVLSNIGKTYSNFSDEEVGDFLVACGYTGAYSDVVYERIRKAFLITDELFFSHKSNVFYVNQDVAKNVTYEEVWNLVIQGRNGRMDRRNVYYDKTHDLWIDFSKPEIDGINIHDWIVAKHGEWRAKSAWYDRYAIWGEVDSKGAVQNPVAPILKLRQREIQYLLGEGPSPYLVDVTSQRTAEEIKFLIENLDPNDPLRQTFEQALESATKNGYISPIENSIQQ